MPKPPTNPTRRQAGKVKAPTAEQIRDAFHHYCGEAVINDMSAEEYLWKRLRFGSAFRCGWHAAMKSKPSPSTRKKASKGRGASR